MLLVGVRDTRSYKQPRLLQRRLEPGPLLRLEPGSLVNYYPLWHLLLLGLVAIHDHRNQLLRHLLRQMWRLAVLSLVPMKAVATKYEPFAVFIECLDHACPQSRAFPQWPEKANADVADPGWQRCRSPGQAVDLKVKSCEQIPGDDRGMVENTFAVGQPRGRVEQDLRRLLVLHRHRLERPAQITVDVADALLNIVHHLAPLIKVIGKGEDDVVERVIFLRQQPQLEFQDE